MKPTAQYTLRQQVPIRTIDRQLTLQIRWFFPFVLLFFSSIAVVYADSPCPLIDKYGQLIATDWPEKTKSDTDLIRDAVNERLRLAAWTPSSSLYDSYGGYRKAGWHVSGSGYFTSNLHKGVWWLITPDGYPCFYKGIDTAPALTWETTPVTGRENLFSDLPPIIGGFSEAWGGDPWGTDPGIQSFGFCTSNLIRKYGPQWKNKFRSLTVQRLKAWGFSGFGKWGDYINGVPSLPVLNRTGVPLVEGGNHPDPFDPSTAQSLKKVLSMQITPHLYDSSIVAWSVGNEGAELISSDEIRDVLLDGADVPAKRALIDFALNNIFQGDPSKMAAAWTWVSPLIAAPSRSLLYSSQPDDIPDGDLEALREFYEANYYALIEQAVKSIDPNHLYAGCWTVQSFEPDPIDWQLLAAYVDVVGFDNYDVSLNAHQVNQLFLSTNKPVICGEFSFPQANTDRGFSVFGSVARPDESSSGKAYANYVTVAANNPFCVGVNWFQYRDEPVTGRGPGYGPDFVYGENYAFGLVDIADQPKWTLVTAVRSANLNADVARSRLK